MSELNWEQSEKYQEIFHSPFYDMINENPDLEVLGIEKESVYDFSLRVLVHENVRNSMPFALADLIREKKIEIIDFDMKQRIFWIIPHR